MAGYVNKSWVVSAVSNQAVQYQKSGLGNGGGGSLGMDHY